MPARRGKAPALVTDNTLLRPGAWRCWEGGRHSPSRRSAEGRRSPARSRSAFLQGHHMVRYELLGLQRPPGVHECCANRITPPLERVTLCSSESCDRHSMVPIRIAKTSSYRVSERV